MANRKQERLAEIRSFAAEHTPIGDVEFTTLLARLSPIREDALRRLLRETGLPLSAAVEGVRQDSFEELARTLTALSQEYERAEPQGRRALRRHVITAKDHARFASRSAKDTAKKQVKEEMVLWLLVWLENPSVFPEWVKLRKRVSAAGISPE